MTTHRERAKAFLPSDPVAWAAQVKQTREQARQAENRRLIPMGRYKTKQRDVVDLPESPTALQAQADRTYKAAVKAFDAIQEAKQRNTALGQVSEVDRSRFPVLGEDEER